MTEKTIIKLDVLAKLARKTKVAAYARVSVGKDAMLHSLATQISYYKKLISENNEWEFAGIYADESLTGTKDSRAEFQQLLKDSRAGKIDMIITKSISRFARNTVTLLKVVRELKSIGVDVFFEEQNIHSLSEEGEMILTFFATFAQEESRSVSENMKWKIRKDFAQGIMWGGKSCLGYRLKNKKLILVPEEAGIVRLIYQLYIDGSGDEQICKQLNLLGIKSKSKTRWYWSTIKSILSNFNYTGDLILQKTYRENHLSKKRKANNGEFDKYIIKGNHKPIISKELYYKVKRIRKERLDKIKSNKVVNDYAFSGMIRCGLCKRGYIHKTTQYKEIWTCSYSSKRGKSECSAKQVPNNKLIVASNYILKRAQFDKDFFKLKVELVEVMPENKLIFHLKDGNDVEYIWRPDSRSNSWTPEMREQARIRALNQTKGCV
jgi:DNA invertase Pin-like site-specific DNA recombinase